MRLTPMTCVLVVGLAVVATQASKAADLPSVRPPLSPVPIARSFSWTGFYVGGNGGWDWMHTTLTDTGPGVFGQVFPIGTSSTIKQNGVMAGAQVGYNYQISQFVVGFEADFDWTNAKTSQSGTLGAISFNTSYKHDYISTFGARFGYAFDRALLYGKAGGAWTRDVFDLTASDGSAATGRFDRWGWMVGAGLEYAIWDSVTIRAEYNYLDFGNRNETLSFNAADLGTATITADPNDTRLHTHVLKLGLNYLFH